MIPESAFSSKHWVWEYHDISTCPATLITALTTGLPHIDPISWQTRFAFGGVYINGLAAQCDQPLTPPCRVEYYEPKFSIEEASNFFPSFSPEQFIYLDSDLFVVYKPPRLPTMPARDQVKFSLKAQVEKHLGQRVHLPSRIDMSAQGLVVGSRQERMHRYLQRCYEKRSIRKVYLLATHSAPAWDSFTADGAIGRDQRHPVLRCVGGHHAKEAVTDFAVLCRPSNSSEPCILSASPHTGRTHQIRVHAAHAGVPILGDKFYGVTPAPQLCLLSFAVELLHPFRNMLLRVVAPPALCPTWIDHRIAVESL